MVGTPLAMGAMVRQTGLSPPTLRLYADAGLIPCEVDSTGRRLFPPMAIEMAKRIHAERLARVGRKLPHAA